MNCTDWQLSVEPGYAPYVPPSSLNEDEEEEEVDDDDDDDGGIISLEEIPGERIEDVSSPYRNTTEYHDRKALTHQIVDSRQPERARRL